LIVVSGPDRGQSFDIEGGVPFVIGRSVATATRLVDGSVSRTHCRIDFERGALRLVDLQSKAGTFVNGRRIARHELREGDTIRIGGTELCFQRDPAEVATTPGRSDRTSILPPQDEPES
jgi:pSer/pThr/pTyr-binding forkhead associated (FHA) protein